MTLTGLTKPILFFDLETTGLLVELDRIIEIALVKIFPDGKIIRRAQRFDPGIKIPMESIVIHGLTNEILAGQPRFVEKAAEFFEIFSDCDLGGFAVHRLDIPMLTKEFEKAGYTFSVEGRRIVDASVIFRERERRDLKSAYRFYCGKELVGAHGAQADADATYEVFLAQLERYPDLPRDMDGLHAVCHTIEPANVDPDGRFVWRDGEAFFNFGKHKYKSLAEVVRSDGDYLEWIINKGEFSKEVLNICSRAKNGVFPRKKVPVHP